MNKQEAIEKIEKLKGLTIKEKNLILDIDIEMIPKGDVLEIIEQIDEPEKPKAPQVAVEFYERYKDDNLALGEWFDDFYSPEAIEEFPRMDELTEWLYGNNDEINRQREFALATLVTLGIDAVEVEKEKLYTVEIPSHGNPDHVVLRKHVNGEVCIDYYLFDNWRDYKCFQLTEAEIKKDFEWAWKWAEEVKDEY